MSVKARTRSGAAAQGCPYCVGKRVFPAESLAAKRPDLAAQWHPTRNGDRAPTTVTVGSNHAVWWQCSDCGHDWSAPVVRRARAGSGCPACAGLVVTAGRSFANRFPAIAAEWHPSRNGDLRPDQIAPFTHKAAWWLCSTCGREWSAAVSGRTADKKGCSTCRPPGWSQVAIRLAAELTAVFDIDDIERAPRAIRDQIGWEPDIVIAVHKVAIDVDGRFWHGDTHHKTRASTDRDNRKSAAFTEAGWRLVRVRESPLRPLGLDDVVVADLRDTKQVAVVVARHLVDQLGLPDARLEAYIDDRQLVGTELADSLIISHQRGRIAGRTLADRFPELVSEWHRTRNGSLRPETVLAGSSRKVWWHGQCGHDWQASLLNRGNGSGCPYCAGTRAGFGNTLADKHPLLAAQWHPTLNESTTPSDVTPGSSRKAWWRCSRGHDWQAVIASRTQGRGCPVCAGRKPEGAEPAG